MSIPSRAGRINQSPGESVQGLYAESLQISDWNDVAKLLGVDRRPHVATAVAFYRDVIGHEFSGSLRQAYLELLGIDFSSPLQRVTLTVGQTVTSYVKMALAAQGSRPHPGRVRTDNKGRALTPWIGKFFTVQGTALERLGIHDRDRAGMHFRVIAPVTALQTRASGIVDAWTDTPMLRNPQLQASPGAIPRIVGGGGTQFRVPKSAANTQHFEPL